MWERPGAAELRQEEVREGCAARLGCSLRAPCLGLLPRWLLVLPLTATFLGVPAESRVQGQERLAGDLPLG